MAETIHVNGLSNSLAHRGCMGFVKNTVPDVCKTPSPGGPIPIPYPVIVSFAKDLSKGTKTVKVDGGNSAAIKGSEYSRCIGDEPGTAGGIISSTNMKEATWLLFSFDVKLDGKNACRLSDKMMMNHKNTVSLGGALHPPVVGETIKEEKPLLCECCDGEAHSKAQAKGESITEEEFYGPSKTGLRKKTGKGGTFTYEQNELSKNEKTKVRDAQAALELTREICPDQAPPSPPGDDPCNKYYRNDSEENGKARKAFDELNNSSNPDRPKGWADAEMIAHRVPLNAGGCPVGANAKIVSDVECSKWDTEFGRYQDDVCQIGRDKL